jgi:hypothetical protein
MKTVCKLIVSLFALYGVPGLAQDYSYSPSPVDEDFSSLVHLSLYGEQEAFLQRKKISIGTILKSHHFSDDGFNDSHPGFYLEIDNWSAGTYENSYYRDSTFVTYNSEFFDSRGLKFSFVAGVADGYTGAPLAQDDYLPILGLSAQMKNLKAMLIYDVLVFGLEFRMN